MARTGLPKKGCFTSAYPGTEWQETSCATAPQRPYRPARGLRSETVGNGTDFSVQVSNLISSATGSFQSVTGVTSESDGSANTYSLQLNTGFFTTSVCGTANPANCEGWQQFIYSNSGYVFMQYWLLNWGTTCPAGWNTDNSDCWKNSSATVVPVQPLSNLANLAVTGTVASGTDTVIMSTGSGQLHATGQDSVLNLAQGWHAAEYNIVGDGNGSAATFNSGSTIVVKLSVADGTSAAPTCAANSGTTGETNSLTLVNPCCPIGGTSSPGITFTESSAAGAKPPFCLTFDIVPISSALLE